MLAGVGTAGLAAACSGDDEPPLSKETIRVGLLAPQTGALKVIGEEIRNGFQLYLDLNDRRLGGHRVELVRADEGESITSGTLALDSLFQQRVVAVAGIANSAMLAAARGQIDAARVPVIAANGMPEALQGATYLWCTSYAEHEPGKALGPLVATRVAKDRKVAIVAPATESGKDAVSGFRFSFGPNDPRVADSVIWTSPRLTVTKGMFADAARRIVNMDAGAVYCNYAGSTAVEFLRQLRAAGSRAQIFAPGLLTDGTVLNELGSEAEGIVTALNYSADLNNAVNQRFTALYRRTHGFAPSAAAVGAYDAAQVIDRAIRVAGGDPTTRAVYYGLDEVGQVQSPRGLWQFNIGRTPLQRWYLREVRRDGPVLSNVTVSELTTLG